MRPDKKYALLTTFDLKKQHLHQQYNEDRNMSKNNDNVSGGGNVNDGNSNTNTATDKTALKSPFFICKTFLAFRTEGFNEEKYIFSSECEQQWQWHWRDANNSARKWVSKKQKLGSDQNFVPSLLKPN